MSDADHRENPGPTERARPTEIVPASAVERDTLLAVFGTRGDPSTCFCQYFKRRGKAWTEGQPADMAADLCAERERAIEAAGAGPGLVAMRGGDPVGWIAVEERTAYSRLLHSWIVRGSAEPHEASDVWAVTCFVVPREHRGQGLAGELLAAAIAHARAHGDRVLEGYPVDTAGERVTSANLYHGALSTFEAAGFEVVARPKPERAVVALGL